MTSVDLSSARWHKSSYSGGGNEDNCVEVALFPSVVAIRDSKSPDSGILSFSPSAWASACAVVGNRRRIPLGT